MHLLVLKYVNNADCSLPVLPHFRCISCCRLPAVSYYWLADQGLILKNLFQPLIRSKISYQGKQIFILAVYINQGIQAAYSLQYRIEFPFTESLLL